MHTAKRFWTLCLGLALMLAAASTALAAGTTMTMNGASLTILPEYDAMNVIVVVSGTFINDTGRPFQDPITWLMPKGGVVSMLCETERGMACQAFQVDSSSPDYDRVTWRPSRVIQPGESFPVMFEYTMNNFTAPGERKFTVPFQSTFPINNLSVEFKQPKNSSNLVLNPASTWTEVDGEGFTNYYYSYGQLKPQEKLSFAVSYTRNETKPSKTAAKPGNNTAQAEVNPHNPWAVVLLVVFLAVLGIFLYYAMAGNGGKSRPKGYGSGKGGAKPGPARGTRPEVQQEKKRIRKLLLDGKISEETYRQMIADIDREN